MNNHTPAPWSIVNHADDTIGIWTKNSGYSTYRIASDVNKTDARLIAAAPELLTALSGLVNIVSGVHDQESLDFHISKSIGALAKAKGENHE